MSVSYFTVYRGHARAFDAGFLDFEKQIDLTLKIEADAKAFYQGVILKATPNDCTSFKES